MSRTIPIVQANNGKNKNYIYFEVTPPSASANYSFNLHYLISQCLCIRWQIVNTDYSLNYMVSQFSQSPNLLVICSNTSLKAFEHSFKVYT